MPFSSETDCLCIERLKSDSVRVLCCTAHTHRALRCFTQTMYASRLRRVGLTTTTQQHHQHVGTKPRCAPRPVGSSSGSGGAPSLRCHSNYSSSGASSRAKQVADVAVEKGEAVLRTARQHLEAVKTGQTRLSMPSTSSIAGAVALVPVAGGVGFATVYAFRHRLCENKLQQV